MAVWVIEFSRLFTVVVIEDPEFLLIGPYSFPQSLDFSN